MREPFGSGTLSTQIDNVSGGSFGGDDGASEAEPLAAAVEDGAVGGGDDLGGGGQVGVGVGDDLDGPIPSILGSDGANDLAEAAAVGDGAVEITEAGSDGQVRGCLANQAEGGDGFLDAAPGAVQAGDVAVEGVAGC